MADYHPIDVRYKGPSTSYQGNRPARSRTSEPRAAQKPATTPKAGPWGGHAQPPAKRSKPRPKVRRRWPFWKVMMFLAIPILILIGPLNLYLFLMHLDQALGLSSLLLGDEMNSISTF